MVESQLKIIENIENDLWEAADHLRANSKLASSEYMMPVLGIIFLRHASNRFKLATRQIGEDQAAGRMPKRVIIKADYLRRGSLWLPEIARWEYIVTPPEKPHDDIGQAIINAMIAIEEEFEPLTGVLPKDYGIFEKDVLEDLLRIFNREVLDQVSGDIFGRINEYFLMKFANAKAHDDGEFFTPSSLVQTIVNIIEPDHGMVFDPACGSCGMFVQTSYFIQKLGEQPAKRVVFYGQEKTATTIKIAKMNLAVHGLEGDIREANTFYEDEHNLVDKCDFVMANPPFNVDMVDAEKVKNDPRLPFGLPGVNKEKKVSNGNFLWISYFWSYLNEHGRSGFVMSSQASSAGHQEKEVRRKIVETGDVDVMIAIRNNFFYTRSVPCELWFFDRGKPAERKDVVLMIDARNIHRKITRKIFDFSPEQLLNISTIVWLYRGQHDRFLNLIKYYLGKVCEESAIIEGKLNLFNSTVNEILKSLSNNISEISKIKENFEGNIQGFTDAVIELNDTYEPFGQDQEKLVKDLNAYVGKYCRSLPDNNEDQHYARELFNPIAEQSKGLIKQIDLLSKLIARALDAGIDLKEKETADPIFDKKGISRLVKQLENQRADIVEQLRLAIYFHRQIVWLQDRFPAAKLQDVSGLVKLVNQSEIEASEWRLSPGQYVGTAPEEIDEEFDFEQVIRDIHIELADLNLEATKLADEIQKNFKELEI